MVGAPQDFVHMIVSSAGFAGDHVAVVAAPQDSLHMIARVRRLAGDHPRRPTAKMRRNANTVPASVRG